MTKTGSGETKTWNMGPRIGGMMMWTGKLEVRADGMGAGRPKPRAWRGRRKRAGTGLPAQLCSPCQLRRQSDRSERPEGGRGGCSRNTRGPDTSSESSAVKKVADGTSGQKDQLRYPGSETAMAATAPVPAGHRLRAGSFRLPAAVSPGNSWGSCRKPRLPGPAHAERRGSRRPASPARGQWGVFSARPGCIVLGPRRALVWGQLQGFGFGFSHFCPNT